MKRKLNLPPLAQRIRSASEFRRLAGLKSAKHYKIHKLLESLRRSHGIRKLPVRRRISRRILP